MKTVIDLEGNEALVPVSTAVKTVNGIHYLLTAEEQAAGDAASLAAAAALADYEANHKYKDLRKAAYPSIEDQLDMRYHDSINGTSTWEDAIAAVKAMYPKP